MKKVWGITSGQYSDWTVHALFETEADAVRAAEAVTANKDVRYHDDASVEEFAFYAAGETPSTVVYWTCYQTLTDDGTVHAGGMSGDDLCRYEDWEFQLDDTAPRLSKRPTVEIEYTPADPSPLREWIGFYNVSICGTDEAAVAKTWSDTLAQWRAQNYRLNAGSVKDLTYRLSHTSRPSGASN